MQRQRDIFYQKGRRLSRAQREHAPPVPQRRFRRAGPLFWDIHFDNDHITAWGGYPLLHNFLLGVGLPQEVARSIRIWKRSNGFTIPELALYLVESKILGVKCLAHLEELRYDPMLKEGFGIDGLPSGKVVGDYLKLFQPCHVDALDRLNTRTLHSLSVKLQETRGRDPRDSQPITIDYDTTTFPVYGEQEGADWGRCPRRKDEPGFQPKFAFLSGLDAMVHQKLCPLSENLIADFDEFHQETLQRVPRSMQVTAVRSDGGLYSLGNVQKFESQGLTYAISASMNGPLRSAVTSIPQEEWWEGIDDYGRPVSLARLHYQPQTWDRPHTYVVSRRLLPDARGNQPFLLPAEAYEYFAYVTNKKATLLNQYQWCVERATLERCVKESKLGFDIDSLPCHGRVANEAYLGHVQLAYNLAVFFKLLVLPADASRWTMGTVRRRILDIPAVIDLEGEQARVSLPSWWPHRETFCQAATQLAENSIPR